MVDGCINGLWMNELKDDERILWMDDLMNELMDGELTSEWTMNSELWMNEWMN